MKTTEKKVKDFDTVKTFREIKDKISKDIQGMTFEELQAYLDKTKLQPKATRLNKLKIIDNESKRYRMLPYELSIRKLHQ